MVDPVGCIQYSQYRRGSSLQPAISNPVKNSFEAFHTIKRMEFSKVGGTCQKLTLWLV